MKVRDLITILQKEDPDLDVCLHVEVHGEGIPDPVGSLDVGEARRWITEGITHYDYTGGGDQQLVLVLQGENAWARAQAAQRLATQKQRSAAARAATTQLSNSLIFD